MKVTRATKIYRPMRRFGQLLKDIFQPKSIHFWVRVKEVVGTKEEKDEQIFAMIEFLSNRIKVDEVQE